MSANIAAYAALTRGVLARAHDGLTIVILGMFAKTGAQTPAFLTKLRNGAPEGTFQELIPGGRSVARSWAIITSLVRNIPVHVQAMFDNLRALLPMDVNLRVALTL